MTEKTHFRINDVPLPDGSICAAYGGHCEENRVTKEDVTVWCHWCGAELAWRPRWDYENV